MSFQIHKIFGTQIKIELKITVEPLLSHWHFWALKVSVALLSMEGQKALGFHQQYLNLCSEDERRSYRFGTTWGWVINDRIHIFGWTIPLMQAQTASTLIFPKVLISLKKINLIFVLCVKNILGWVFNLFILKWKMNECLSWNHEMINEKVFIKRTTHNIYYIYTISRRN